MNLTYPRLGTCLHCGQPLIRNELRHIYHENCLRATVDLTEREREARAKSIQATPNLRRKREKKETG